MYTSSRNSGDAGGNGRGRNEAKQSGVPLEAIPSSVLTLIHKKESDLCQLDFLVTLHSNIGTIGFALGFALMMVLDVVLG